jgi:hypothetical protein
MIIERHDTEVAAMIGRREIGSAAATLRRTKPNADQTGR